MRRSSLSSGPHLALVTAAVVVALATSCGGSSGSGSSASGTKAASQSPAASAPAAGVATLRISGFAFSPPLTVSPNTLDGAQTTIWFTLPRKTRGIGRLLTKS